MPPTPSLTPGGTPPIVPSNRGVGATQRAAPCGRLHPGSHLGQLFIGMEHIHSANLVLASQFIQQSLHACRGFDMVALA